ncbi:MAG: CHAT domain-containing protein [bacterium]
MIKILFLAANPLDTDRLRLDEEIRAIDEKLHQAEYRDMFEIKAHLAVCITDIQSLLLRHKPDIVHFSGHGSKSSEIIMEDDSGNSKPVTVSALSQLFSILKDNIRCVVLNACYSDKQAMAIAEHIECVVGMSKAIGDLAAISFSAAFYQGLGYGRDVKSAFDLGCSQINLENLGEQNIPRLLALRNNPNEIVFVCFSPECKKDSDSSSLSKKEIHSLQKQLESFRRNLILIKERMAEFVLETDIPLQLIRSKEDIESKIAELEKKLGG